MLFTEISCENWEPSEAFQCRDGRPSDCTTAMVALPGEGSPGEAALLPYVRKANRPSDVPTRNIKY
jgi:hypothetical protein